MGVFVLINGTALKNSIISGAHNIFNQKDQINDLNVFPIPDGDTGTNMSMTALSVILPMSNLSSPSVGHVLEIASIEMLKSARGNSGVILSLIFKGFYEALKNKETASISDIILCFEKSVEYSYKSVSNPTEGTILTVIRLISEYSKKIEKKYKYITDFLSDILEQGHIFVNQTKEMLPVLQKADVVDAGAFGFISILEGMVYYIKTQNIINKNPTTEASSYSNIVDIESLEEVINFSYCTEFLINKDDTNKNLDISTLKTYLDLIGDSVVVVPDTLFIKIHLHTDNPGKALQKSLKYGYLTDIKIENMREQYKKIIKTKQDSIKDIVYTPTPPINEYGFVSICSGRGIENIFKDLSVDTIVYGGQTMNPSTDDILNAILSTPAQNVFVLPNNKNIFMAAEQAAKLADRNVCVLQSKNIPHGISAMLTFNSEISFSENTLYMTKSFENISTGQITFAEKDSNFDGHNIKNNEILAMQDGKLAFVEKDVSKALIKLIKNMITRDSSYITIIYGSDISTAQAETIFSNVESKFSSNIEITLINGGQPVYYYIVSVE